MYFLSNPTDPTSDPVRSSPEPKVFCSSHVVKTFQAKAEFRRVVDYIVRRWRLSGRCRRKAEPPGGRYRFTITEINSQRGKAKFEHDGHLYVFDKRSSDGTTTFWRCDSKGGKGTVGCKGRIWTSTVDGTFHSLRAAHTCSAVGDANRVGLSKIVTGMKRRAENTQETPLQNSYRAGTQCKRGSFWTNAFERRDT